MPTMLIIPNIPFTIQIVRDALELYANTPPTVEAIKNKQYPITLAFMLQAIIEAPTAEVIKYNPSQNFFTQLPRIPLPA